MKSKHIFSNWNISFDELKHFIDPIKLEIPICPNILNNTNNSFYNVVTSMNEVILDEILDDGLLKNKLICKYGISYIPCKDEYKLGYSPINLINTILNILNVDKEISFYNLDDEDELNIAINEAKEIIQSLNSSYNLDCILNNMNKIFELRTIDIEEYIINNSNIQAKDLLFYVACYSLTKLQLTRNSIYSIIPKEYYDYVSNEKCINKSPYPHRVKVLNGSMWIDSFNYQYIPLTLEKELFNYKNEYNLGVKNFYADWIIFPNDHNVYEKTGNHITRQIREIDDKYYELFKEKINFFEHSPYKYQLVGQHGLKGYYAFVYDNDYILSDKFYNTESKKSILTHSEAAYALPADSYEVTKLTKTEMIEASHLDNRIKRIYHTNNYLDKFNEVINYPNISRISFDEIYAREKQKQKLLKLS